MSTLMIDCSPPPLIVVCSSSRSVPGGFGVKKREALRCLLSSSFQMMLDTHVACMMHVFRREEGVAVDGDHHGDAISTDQKLFTFQTIY